MQLARAVRRPQPHTDLCAAFCSLYIAARGLSSTTAHRAEGSSNNATPNPMHSAPPQALKQDANARSYLAGADMKRIPKDLDQSPAQRAAEATRKAKERMDEQRKKMESAQKVGGLADNSIFADEPASDIEQPTPSESGSQQRELTFAERNPANMEARLNPNPNARARWQRTMVIREIRRRGRLTREMKIARSERSHMSKSAFFKTSVKKLMPLARQIAGKSIDEAILQMRFSKKKAALRVRQHLVQARNEAIVMRGMGLNSITATNDTDSPVNEDPGISPPLPHQNPNKSLKDGVEKSPTDVYVSEAWVNRGPYREYPLPRARGRMDIPRAPHTGISVVLKEEKTRMREKMEKEAKAIKRRMSKNMWTQLPDRPITRQSQYLLW